MILSLYYAYISKGYGYVPCDSNIIVAAPSTSCNTQSKPCSDVDHAALRECGYVQCPECKCSVM